MSQMPQTRELEALDLFTRHCGVELRAPFRGSGADALVALRRGQGDTGVPVHLKEVLR